MALMSRPEVGLAEVELTPGGRNDRLLTGIGPTMQTFQWHGAEIKEMPPGDRCPGAQSGLRDSGHTLRRSRIRPPISCRDYARHRIGLGGRAGLQEEPRAGSRSGRRFALERNGRPPSRNVSRDCSTHRPQSHENPRRPSWRHRRRDDPEPPAKTDPAELCVWLQTMAAWCTPRRSYATCLRLLFQSIIPVLRTSWSPGVPGTIAVRLTGRRTILSIMPRHCEKHDRNSPRAQSSRPCVGINDIAISTSLLGREVPFARLPNSQSSATPLVLSAQATSGRRQSSGNDSTQCTGSNFFVPDRPCAAFSGSPDTRCIAGTPSPDRMFCIVAFSRTGLCHCPTSRPTFLEAQGRSKDSPRDAPRSRNSLVIAAKRSTAEMILGTEADAKPMIRPFRFGSFT